MTSRITGVDFTGLRLIGLIIWMRGDAGAPELEDVQDDCAWRMGQWTTVSNDEEQQLAHNAVEDGRFNYAVLHTLRALAGGDRDGCQDLLTSARRVCNARRARNSRLLKCSASCILPKQPVETAQPRWTCRSGPVKHIQKRPCLDTTT